MCFFEKMESSHDVTGVGFGMMLALMLRFHGYLAFQTTQMKTSCLHLAFQPKRGLWNDLKST